MSALPLAMPFDGTKFFGDTRTLPPLQRMAVLLAQWYQHMHGALPKDLESIILIMELRQYDPTCNAPSIARALLEHYFQHSADGLWRDAAVAEVRERQQAKRLSNQQHAQLAARARWRGHEAKRPSPQRDFASNAPSIAVSIADAPKRAPAAKGQKPPVSHRSPGQSASHKASERRAAKRKAASKLPPPPQGTLTLMDLPAMAPRASNASAAGENHISSPLDVLKTSTKASAKALTPNLAAGAAFGEGEARKRVVLPLDPAILAAVGHVMELGPFTDPAIRKAVLAQVRVQVKQGEDAATTGRLMVRRWLEYQEADVRVRYGPEKFFSGGLWMNMSGWHERRHRG